MYCSDCLDSAGGPGEWKVCGKVPTGGGAGS